jgi:hypothetical protein
MRFKPERRSDPQHSANEDPHGGLPGCRGRAALLSAAPARGRPSGVVYGGETPQDWPATSRLTGDFYDATGKLVDTCRSGKIRWTARP